MREGAGLPSLPISVSLKLLSGPFASPSLSGRRAQFSEAQLVPIFVGRCGTSRWGCGWHLAFCPAPKELKSPLEGGTRTFSGGLNILFCWEHFNIVKLFWYTNITHACCKKIETSRKGPETCITDSHLLILSMPKSTSRRAVHRWVISWKYNHIYLLFCSLFFFFLIHEINFF